MATTATIIPPHRAAAQAGSERLISRLLRTVQGSCDDLLHHRDVAKRTENQRKDLAEHHPEFAAADLRSVAVYWSIVFLPLAVWVIDVALLNGVSEYLATLLFPEHPRVVLAARFLVALAVVGLEVGLALRLHHAHEAAAETENRVPYVLCWAAVVVWAAFLASCLVATQQAAGAEDETSTRTLMYALAGFCFLLHLLIPFSHELLHEAKGYVLFHVRDAKLRGTALRAGRGERAGRRVATNGFQLYARDLNRYNSLYSPPLPAGPFSVASRTVVNEIFGDGTIPPPHRPPAGDAPAADAPAPAPSAPLNGPGAAPAESPRPPDAPEAENEYLRMILSRRQRDEESEVRA